MNALFKLLLVIIIIQGTATTSRPVVVDPIPRLLCRPGSRARLFLFTTPLLARYYWVSSLFLGLFTGNLERAEADQAKPNQQSTGLREQRQEQEKKSNEKSKIRNSIDHRSQSQISISSSEV
ncbi:hypothetical protein TESG_02679 [Trichophyton tonsurans CBS 112818]|uniref:Secreted protein n=1 Tax=Trichophyton tonsurans (strain CBS 112818) TaxID=647933 RepID=F2RUX3_TRIT1|nr:hypothetical protein TESG_02679 [Trichophyton tonsurans CBS 112818]